MSEGGGIGPISAYVVPKCGLQGRVLYGNGAKENRNGFHSMYGKLDRDAKKNANQPGPGKYPLDQGYEQVQDRPPKWSMSKLGRDGIAGGGKNKVPGPGTYDKQAWFATQPRVAFGKLLKGPRSKGLAATSITKGPGSYTVQHQDAHQSCPDLNILKRKTIPRPIPKKDAPGPGTYNPDWKQIEDRRPMWKMSKADGSMRFTDQAVKSAAWRPPPGKYDQVNAKVFSRGTKWSQLHGVGRSSLHGTF